MVDLINANADAFAYARVIRPPVTSGLEFWNYYGGASDMRRNLAPNKPAAIPVGDPTGGDFYIRCEGMIDYIQTAAAASDEFTLIAVAKTVLPDAGSAPLISNTGSISQTGVATTGAAIYLNDTVQGNNLIRLTAQQASNNAGASAAVVASTQDFNASITGVQMFAGRCEADGDRVANIMGTALNATTPSALPAMLAQPYRIGSQYSSGIDGIVDIYAAIIYSRALSDAELTAVYDFVRTFYARRGITI